MTLINRQMKIPRQWNLLKIQFVLEFHRNIFSSCVNIVFDDVTETTVKYDLSDFFLDTNFFNSYDYSSAGIITSCETCNTLATWINAIKINAGLKFSRTQTRWTFVELVLMIRAVNWCVNCCKNVSRCVVTYGSDISAMIRLEGQKCCVSFSEIISNDKVPNVVAYYSFSMNEPVRCTGEINK